MPSWASYDFPLAVLSPDRSTLVASHSSWDDVRPSFARWRWQTRERLDQPLAR